MSPRFLSKLCGKYLTTFLRHVASGDIAYPFYRFVLNVLWKVNKHSEKKFCKSINFHLFVQLSCASAS